MEEALPAALSLGVEVGRLRRAQGEALPGVGKRGKGQEELEGDGDWEGGLHCCLVGESGKEMQKKLLS